MNHKDIADSITALVIEQLNKGEVPWRKPWTCRGFLPTSLTTGKPYSGLNVLLLSLAQSVHGYEHPLWLTFRETNRREGRVIAGSKSTLVIKWGTYTKVNSDGKESTRFYLREHRVFNIAQTTLDIPEEFKDNREPISAPDGIQTILDAYKNRPEVYHKAGDSAHYSPLTDSITLPKMEQFASASDYAYTLAHELTHSTGHESRLNRFSEDDKPARFGDANYAREELVADIGANLLLSSIGVDLDLNNSASYIKGWLKALQNDTSLIVSASSRAQRAADYIMGRTKSEDPVASEDLVKA